MASALAVWSLRLSAQNSTKGGDVTAWLAPYPLLKNNQTTADRLQECLQREMPPVSLGYSSCYDERGYGATSGLAFVEVMGAQMWVWRLELEVPSSSLARNQESIFRHHA